MTLVHKHWTARSTGCQSRGHLIRRRDMAFKHPGQQSHLYLLPLHADWLFKWLRRVVHSDNERNPGTRTASKMFLPGASAKALISCALLSGRSRKSSQLIELEKLRKGDEGEFAGGGCRFPRSGSMSQPDSVLSD